MERTGKKCGSKKIRKITNGKRESRSDNRTDK
jgi:hypothetical protein